MGRFSVATLALLAAAFASAVPPAPLAGMQSTCA